MWQQSEWGKARAARKDAKTAKRWVGTSFDVGVFLGIDLLQVDSPIERMGDGSAATSTIHARHPPPPSTAKETFVTAPSELTPGEPSSSQQPQSGSSLRPNRDEHDDDARPVSAADSTTPLLLSTKSTENGSAEAGLSVTPLPPRSNMSKLDSQTSPKGKGKEKTVHVHYAEHVPEGDEDESPAPPQEVLARTGNDVQRTSAGAAQQASRENQVKWGDVVMRDRMLVRASYTEMESLGTGFDEAQDRVTSHIQNDNWREYIVAWRKDRLELYKDHRNPGSEWLTGHKHLSFIIPLDSLHTRLSLYSFVDMSFCLTCPPTPLKSRSKRRWLAYTATSKKGTNVFVFKVKSRTRATDWIWHIWHHMGGKIPPSIIVRAPFLDTRFKIDIPTFPNSDVPDLHTTYQIFTRSNIVALCEKGLRTVPAYHALMEQNREKGVSLELAWRLDTYLDWVWMEEDVQGYEREWGVICGLALRQAKRPAHLELRIHRHIPTRIHLKDGTRLDEPPSIEGYVDRIRPNTQLKQPLYLTTHDGYLFTLSPAHAHPPMPPGAPIFPSDSKSGSSLQEDEVRRGREQILRATGMTDLRSIVAVRRAFQIVPRNTDVEQMQAYEGENVQSGAAGGGRVHVNVEDTEEFWRTPADRRRERWGSAGGDSGGGGGGGGGDSGDGEGEGENGVGDNDFDDVGGEEGLSRTSEKAKLRMRRSFEFLMASGRVIRFETHSCADAIEWITRLRPLVSYWRKRHQVDARQEMDLAHEAGRSRISPPVHEHPHYHEIQDTLPGPDASLPELSTFYNWCVLDGCRPILKCGRLYWRKGLRGQYKHIQLVLVSGHLVQFHVTGKPAMHHRRHLTVNLLDAYIVSGYFAAQHLPSGQYNPDNPPLARRYRDGLESDENEEDTLFMLWYRPNVPSEESLHSPSSDEKDTGEGTKEMKRKDVPPLKAKRKLGVFRTRSKLERDAWVWAINAEIERCVRRPGAKAREERIRRDGELIRT
ncbi:hypothetical protein K474DRAFT_1687553 [Panus rudis PR-1116 ss-1]|nr:hypothetical protein K474DRAFT_1687553 [Panus rudis PR-1116 ss-1]